MITTACLLVPSIQICWLLGCNTIIQYVLSKHFPSIFFFQSVLFIAELFLFTVSFCSVKWNRCMCLTLQPQHLLMVVNHSQAKTVVTFMSWLCGNSTNVVWQCNIYFSHVNRKITFLLTRSLWRYCFPLNIIGCAPHEMTVKLSFYLTTRLRHISVQCEGSFLMVSNISAKPTNRLSSVCQICDDLGGGFWILEKTINSFIFLFGSPGLYIMYIYRCW